ncbi:MAG: DUF998 domain-containing protein [Halobacteriales archaeon]
MSVSSPSVAEGGLDRATRLAGAAAVAVSVVAVFGSAALASWATGSWFGWTTHALSALGAPHRATAPVFNAGLVLAGALGVAFTWRVGCAGTNAAHRLGAALLGLSFASLALVGVFDVTRPLHVPVAVAFFLLFTYGLFVHGTGDVLAGAAGRGLRSVWYAVAHVTGWLLFAALPLSGIALPELVGSLALWAWTLQLVVDLRP